MSEKAVTAVFATPYCCFMAGYQAAVSAHNLTETHRISPISSSATSAMKTTIGPRARVKELEKEERKNKDREHD